MDLADFVSEQGETAGKNAAIYAAGLTTGTDLPLQKWEKDLHNVARKGMPEKNSVTCTLCPRGCQVRISENGTITRNGCRRGEEFARQELTDPQRILTTTVKIKETGELLPVRSDRPVPLRQMQRLARALQQQTVSLPPEGIRRGDVLVRDLGGKEVYIIAEKTIRTRKNHLQKQ